eukprot:m.126660 g.126660  ORF g.126660 m.126660 type:complete len:358 (-) comp13840_c0_seq1:3919-4992(-)
MAHRRRYDSDEDDMDDDDRRSRRPGGAADDDQEQDDDGGDRASMSRDYDKTRSKPSLLPAPIRYAGPHDPEGPLAPTETQWGKDHFRLRQPNYAHEILPITPMEEQGWSLQVSRNGRLFWSHPDHGEQWETPAEIKPCLWRVCFQPNGSPAICNMETEELLDAAPDTLPMRQYEEPGDWIKDERDGKIRWFNPRLMKLTRRVPQCLVGQTDVKQNWVVEEAQQHLRYIHNYTREAVYRDTVTERRQETFLQLSAEADAPSNALVDYSASGMSGVFNKVLHVFIELPSVTHNIHRVPHLAAETSHHTVHYIFLCPIRPASFYLSVPPFSFCLIFCFCFCFFLSFVTRLLCSFPCRPFS